MSGDVGSVGHRLVIGPGGSGTTHVLESWVGALGGSPEVEIRGDPVVAPDPALVERIDRGAGLLVVHDVHWVDDAVVRRLVHATARRPVWASRRPWPVDPAVRSLDDRLTADRAATRTAALGLDDVAALTALRSGRAVPTAVAERLHHLTSGWVGPLVDVLDALESGWDLGAAPPPALTDRIMRRVERAGPDAALLVRVLAVDPSVDLTTAVRAAGGRGDAGRAAAAGGLLDPAERLVPIVATVVRSDLDEREVEEVHDQLARVLATVDRERAVEHAAAGTAGDSIEDVIAAIRRALIREPERARELIERTRRGGSDDPRLDVLEAELHLRAGRVEPATRAIAGVPRGVSGAARVVAGIELRHGRWGRVAEIAGGERSLGPLARLADVAGARVDVASREHDGAARRRPFDLVVDGLVDLLEGRTSGALRSLTEAADDDALGDDSGVVGISASFVAGLAAVVLGEVSTADEVLDQGRRAGVGGPGEQPSLAVLHQYVQLRRSGAFGVAPGDDEADDAGGHWERDRLLSAALATAVARRSGDLGRLRQAWTTADPVLVRAHPSWLLLEPLTDLLTTGARLGRDDRVQPVLDALRAQANSTAPGGPVRAAAAWMGLHVALAGDDPHRADESVSELTVCATASAHAAARARAARTWIAVLGGRIDEAEVVAAVEALIEVQEGWEAARLAGQAALDASDPAVTRRLLERARSAAVDPTATLPDGEDGLVALGLSEREAEVARLVADGRTHREIGAELYISPKTVEHHVARIRQKLDASSRAELIAVVREHG